MCEMISVTGGMNMVSFDLETGTHLATDQKLKTPYLMLQENCGYSIIVNISSGFSAVRAFIGITKVLIFKFDKNAAF